MLACTFFGHKDTPDSIEEKLRATIIDLITNKNIYLFYVGNQGNFDYMVRKNLRELKHEYPHIQYSVVLAYYPYIKDDYNDYSDTIYPEILENTPRKYAIIKRNEWMIGLSDYVVTYVKHSTGGASKFKTLAEKQNKHILNLADYSTD